MSTIEFRCPQCDKLLRVGAAYQELTDWHRRRPTATGALGTPAAEAAPAR